LGGALLGGQLSADGREVIAQAVSASLTAPRNSNIALSFSSNRAATRASSCWIASRMAASASWPRRTETLAPFGRVL
jgi:hypothetical protein